MNNGFTTNKQKKALSAVVCKLTSVTFYLAKNSASVARSAMMCFARFMIAYDHGLVSGKALPIAASDTNNSAQYQR